VRESEWSIGEVARRAGLKRSAIRYYEQIGLLPKAERVGGQRRYDTAVLTRLSIIDVARRAGFTLAETGTLLEGFAPKAPPSERWEALARQKLSDVDALIERANGMKRLLQEGLECGCPSLEECGFLLAHGAAVGSQETAL
jgi:MerR family transcriptional regulator, redox-sensitive transcriptional activator SoxR